MGNIIYCAIKNKLLTRILHNYKYCSFIVHVKVNFSFRKRQGKATFLLSIQ